MAISTKALVIGIIIGFVIGGVFIWFVKPKEIERVTETVLVTETISGPTETVTKTITSPTAAVTKTAIRFIFDFTRKASDSYKDSTDARELAAAFDFIQFLDRDSSVLKTIGFGRGDETYLGEGWYGREDWNGRDISWAGKNATIILDDLDILNKAHFLRIMAGSIGKTEYQEWDAEFKDLMSDPQGIQVYFNGNLTDKINIYPRMQISYVNLKPEADSDLDGIIDKLDRNPRIPEPKPVESDISIGIVYLLEGAPEWWSLYLDSPNAPLHPLPGRYNIQDPDVTDWQIKEMVEHGVNTLFVINTGPVYGGLIPLENGLLRAKYLDYIKFSMEFNPFPWMPGNTFGNDPNRLSEITNWAMRYYSENYFDHPSYAKVGNKPMMIVWHACEMRYLPGWDIKKYNSYIKEIRTIAERHGYNLFLIGDLIEDRDWQFMPDEKFYEEARYFDDFTGSTINNAGCGWKYPELVEPYESMILDFAEISQKASERSRKYGVKFIPLVQSGFDNSIEYKAGIDDWLVNRTNPSPEKFREMCEAIKPYIDQELRMVRVASWNGYDEGIVVEPTEEFGLVTLMQFVMYSVER